MTFDLDLLWTVLFLLAIGWLTTRLLGVRRGFWRSLFAGLVGLLAGYILVVVQYGDIEQLNELSDLPRLGFGFIGYVLLVTMITSVVLEAVLRPRDRRRRRHRLPRPFRWIRAKFALAQRVWDIGMAARRHGLVGRKYASKARLTSPEGARALRLTLEDCGGMFVKFGQIAAGRDDLLPATVTAELGELRSAVKPLPIETVREQLTQEFGDRYQSMFETFDDEPLAAASVGVTHRATLPGGRRVIVKIQRPQIDEIVERDGRVLLWGARQLERGSESARSLGLVDLARELLRSVSEELDFRREAANNAAMRRNRASDEGIGIPMVDQSLTTRRILVMDEVQAVSVADTAAVARAPVPRRELADRLLRSFLGQVLNDGVYHADPHPGNILIDEQGTLWFIDFGAVGHIDPITLEALQQMAIGFTLRDPGLLARSVRRIVGGSGQDLDMPSLEYDMGQVLGDIEGAGFGPAAISQVIRVLQRHSIKAPRTLTVLGRAAVTIEGTLRDLAPGYRMAQAAQQLVTADDTVAGSGRDLAMKELTRALPSLRPLPQLTEDVALQLRAGRLSLRVSTLDGPDGLIVERLLDRVLWAALSVAGLLGSAVLLLAGQFNVDSLVSVYLRYIGFGGLVVSSAMQMRAVARLLNRRLDP